MSTFNNMTPRNGIGGVLFIVFLILKLTNVISWSWGWVIAPLWISLLIFIIILVFYIVFLCWKINNLEKENKNGD